MTVTVCDESSSVVGAALVDGRMVDASFSVMGERLGDTVCAAASSRFSNGGGGGDDDDDVGDGGGELFTGLR